jgi:uncharacterized protein (DUF1499 family)
MAYQESIAFRPRRSAAAALGLWGFWLAVIALIALVAVPAGWRLDLWPFTVSLRLMRYSAYGGVLACVASLAALIGWRRLSTTRRAMATVGLLLGATLFYVPWHYTRIAMQLPAIHDITTDPANPPVFVTVLGARNAQHALPVEYGGVAVAKQQLAAYPDIKPVETALPPDEAYRRALDVAQRMPGWIDIAPEPSARRIEASQSSFWMDFTDDIVIRVAREGSGSRIDVRSLSRQGSGDFGVNAARVRAYIAALDKALAPAP